jgi:hypothetical protein
MCVLPCAAVLVWSRALGLLTPLSSKLGAMLYILRRGAEEAGVLVPVVIVLMLVSVLGHAYGNACCNKSSRTHRGMLLWDRVCYFGFWAWL